MTNAETNDKKKKKKQLSPRISQVCFQQGEVAYDAIKWWKTETHPEKVRPNFPFSYSLSDYLLGDCLISGQTVIPRNYGVFNVHRDIVPNVFSQQYIQPFPTIKQQANLNINYLPISTHLSYKHFLPGQGGSPNDVVLCSSLTFFFMIGAEHLIISRCFRFSHGPYYFPPL